MSDLNHVVIVGRLTRDCELRYTRDRVVGKLSIAWNRRRRNAKGDWENEPHYFDVTVWGKYAEDKRLVKGARVMVTGALRYETWEAKDKTKRSRVSINADSLELLDAPVMRADPAELAGDEIPF